MSQMNIEEAKAYLQKSSGGTNLYDHLSEVLLKILIEKPENSCESFENISEAVKQARSKIIDPEDQVGQFDINAKTQQEEFCNSSYGIGKPGEEEEIPAPASGVADLLDEANMFEWAGIGFSKSETYRLSTSIQALAAKHATTSMRLWGKMLGKTVDYYIAEGQLGDAYEPEDLNLEEGGNGANKFTYWCMKDDGSYKWIQLPNVTRKQILGARKLKRFVNDDLEGDVTGNPPFPGKEKNFLRAQIARIGASTVLCPAGFYSVSDDGELEVAEEIESKTARELSEESSWVHLQNELNAVYGRSTSMPPREGDDGEELPWENDDVTEPLKSISEDANGSWKVSVVPVTASSCVGELAIVKSLLWPGAVSVGLGKKFLNIYVGHGLKHSDTAFQPALPGELQTEYGVAPQEEDPSQVVFTNLSEQPDILQDPTPPEEEETE